MFGSSSEPFAMVDRPLCRRKAIAIGRKGTVDRPFVIQPGFWAVDTCMFHTVQRKDYSLEYLGYWSNIVPWQEIATQTALPSLTQTDANNVIVGCPPFDEQCRIAAWLDLQTGRIDKRRKLLGKKRELLQDLRQTLLDEAISTGLAKCQIVKTGQPTLQNLPAHWSLSKFKSKVFFREGPGIMAADFADTGVPLIRIGNITSGLITMAGCNYVAPEKAERQWRQFKLKLGDLVISASASTGIVAEAGSDAVGSIPYTGLIILRPKDGLSKAFLRLFVISKAFLAQVEDYLKGSTIHHFGPTHLRQMLISVPPLEEQEEIAAFLARKLSQIDRQVALIDQLDDLLQQQRKAIIHEAVTGKIDLSGAPVGDKWSPTEVVRPPAVREEC